MDDAPDRRPAGPVASSSAPIIVTAEMGPMDQSWANGLRERHFPPHRNQLPAHITLFHHLPPRCLGEVQSMLAELARGARPPARIDRLLSLGQGVALHVHSPALMDMRAELAERFAGMLTLQDAGKPRLHITIQNKVTAQIARETLALLEADFRPRPLVLAGLAAWEYRGGPWALVRRYGFRG